jgi:hypothetical protein
MLQTLFFKFFIFNHYYFLNSHNTFDEHIGEKNRFQPSHPGPGQKTG